MSGRGLIDLDFMSTRPRSELALCTGTVLSGMCSTAGLLISRASVSNRIIKISASIATTLWIKTAEQRCFTLHLSFRKTVIGGTRLWS